MPIYRRLIYNKKHVVVYVYKGRYVHENYTMKTEFNKIKKHDNLWIFITNIVLHNYIKFKYLQLKSIISSSKAIFFLCSQWPHLYPFIFDLWTIIRYSSAQQAISKYMTLHLPITLILFNQVLLLGTDVFGSDSY